MNQSRKHLISAAFAFATMIILMFVFEAGGIDLWLQNVFYDAGAKRWLVDRANTLGDVLFYIGPKSAIIVFSIGLGLTGFASFFVARLKPHRLDLWLTLAAMALITAGVSFAKAETHIYCPHELTQYGGKAIYNPITEKMLGHFAEQPSEVKKGRCFPAGHASGGFALMALALLLTPARRKWAYVGGMTIGWIMGLYQTLNGAHFISHTVTTMLWAIFVTSLTLYIQTCRQNRHLP